MSNYIDLEPAIASKYDMNPGTIRVALGLLDHFATEHPDQVPGLTITQSEYRDTLNHAVKTSGYGDDWERGFCTGLNFGGTKVIPDPEPTNAEKAAADLEAWGMLRAGALELGPWLAGQGWVKAPGGDDE